VLHIYIYIYDISRLRVNPLFLGAFIKLRKTAISFVMSVRLSVWTSVHQHGTTRLPLEEFELNLILDNFSKTCWGNLSFITIWQELFYTLHEDIYTFTIVSRRIFLRKRNIFRTFAEKKYFRKSGRLWNNVGKSGTARQASGDSTKHASHVPGNFGSKHTICIFDISWFCTTTMVTQTCFNITFITILVVFSKLNFVHWKILNYK